MDMKNQESPYQNVDWLDDNIDSRLFKIQKNGKEIDATQYFYTDSKKPIQGWFKYKSLLDERYVTIGEYKNGLKEGWHIEYLFFRKITALTLFDSGLQTGSSIAFYEDSQHRCASIVNYLHDNLHGFRYHFDRNGKLIRKDFFDNGVLKSHFSLVCNILGCTSLLAIILFFTDYWFYVVDIALGVFYLFKVLIVYLLIIIAPSTSMYSIYLFLKNMNRKSGKNISII